MPNGVSSLCNIGFVTTASTSGYLAFGERRFVHLLCAILSAVSLWTGSHPEKAFDWWLENAAAFTFLAILAFTYRRLPLSDLSYLLIAVYLCLHEWGAQYKYTDVPPGEWIKSWIGTERNHYDRVMHFSYGALLAYPCQEWSMRVAGVWNNWRYLLPVALILSCSAVYEMIESLLATVLTPERGEEFVGMQGDMWDSQKDMALAGLGAALQMSIIFVIRLRRARAARVALTAPDYEDISLTRR